MDTDLQFLEEWIPEKMDPGTVFLLENQSKLGSCAESIHRCHVLSSLRNHGIDHQAPALRKRDDDLRRRHLLRRISPRRRKHPLSPSPIAIRLLRNICILSDGRGATELKDLRCLSGLFNRYRTWPFSCTNPRFPEPLIKAQLDSLQINLPL